MTDIGRLVAELLPAMDDRRSRLGQDPTTRIGTVVSADSDRAFVILDGDDDVATPVESTVGALSVGDRAMVLLLPPHGAYVIGPIGATGGPVTEELAVVNWTNAGQPTCRWQQVRPEWVVAHYDWTMSGDPPGTDFLEVDLPIQPAHFPESVIGFAKMNHVNNLFGGHSVCVLTDDGTAFRIERKDKTSSPPPPVPQLHAGNITGPNVTLQASIEYEPVL